MAEYFVHLLDQPVVAKLAFELNLNTLLLLQILCRAYCLVPVELEVLC